MLVSKQGHEYTFMPKACSGLHSLVPPGTHYHRRTQKERKAVIDEIYKLKGLGYTDTEIIEKMQITENAYYRYRQKLYQQHGQRFGEAVSEDSLACSMQTLEDRLNKIYRTLNIFVTRAASDRADPMSAREIAPVAIVMENIAINLFKLQHEGLRIVKGNGALTRYDGYPQGGRPAANIQVLPSSASTAAELSQRKF